MIKNILFDFGDVFLNLDKTAVYTELKKLGCTATETEILELNELYEIGDMTTENFIAELQQFTPNASATDLKNAWNSILKDFPAERLEFLKALADSEDYKLLFLSNTNDLHIEWVEQNIPFFEEFKAQFDQFYLSQELGMRKPNPMVYQFILDMNNITAEETLFIDDTKANTDSAAMLGCHVWNIIPEKEDVTQLFTIKKELF